MTQQLYAGNGYPIQNRKKLVLEATLDEMDKLQKKQIKPYIIKNILYRVINSNIEKVPMSVAVKINEEQLSTAFNDFLDLMCMINSYCNFVPSKQLFAAFLGISVSAYDELLKHGDEEQKLIMDSIDSAIIDLALDSAQNGLTKANVVTFRMKAKNQGHGIVQATPLDGVIEKQEQLMTPKDAQALLQQIVGMPAIDEPK